MAKQKKTENNTEKPVEKILVKSGVSYGIVALAFVADFWPECC